MEDSILNSESEKCKAKNGTRGLTLHARSRKASFGSFARLLSSSVASMSSRRAFSIASSASGSFAVAVSEQMNEVFAAMICVSSSIRALLKSAMAGFVSNVGYVVNV